MIEPRVAVDDPRRVATTSPRRRSSTRSTRSSPTNTLRYSLLQHLLAKGEKGGSREIASFEIARFVLPEAPGRGHDLRPDARHAAQPRATDFILRVNASSGLNFDGRLTWDTHFDQVTSASVTAIRHGRRPLSRALALRQPPGHHSGRGRPRRLGPAPDRRRACRSSRGVSVSTSRRTTTSRRASMLESRSLLTLQASCFKILVEYRDLAHRGDAVAGLPGGADAEERGQLPRLHRKPARDEGSDGGTLRPAGPLPPSKHRIRTRHSSILAAPFPRLRACGRESAVGRGRGLQRTPSSIDPAALPWSSRGRRHPGRCWTTGPPDVPVLRESSCFRPAARCSLRGSSGSRSRRRPRTRIGSTLSGRRRLRLRHDPRRLHGGCGTLGARLGRLRAERVHSRTTPPARSSRRSRSI